MGHILKTFFGNTRSSKRKPTVMKQMDRGNSARKVRNILNILNIDRKEINENPLRSTTD